MSNRFYGIEIELEQIRLASVPPSLWTYEGDGSLRNRGMEFKSIEPLPIATAKDSLIMLDDFFERHGMEPEANDRCSVHIHMDVRDMSNNQIYNMLCNYSLIEPMFFAHVAEHRADSHFCVPYYHCRDTARAIMNAIKDHEPNEVSMQGRKYMALNVLPMYRFGSVEWRHFPAVLPVKRVIPWLDLIDTIKTASLDGRWSDSDVEAFANEYMPGVYDEDRMDVGLETYYYHMLTPQHVDPPSRRFGNMFHRDPFEDHIDFGPDEEEDPDYEPEPITDEEEFLLGPETVTQEELDRARDMLRRDFSDLFGTTTMRSLGGDE